MIRPAPASATAFDLSGDLREALLRHAHAELPKEACGLVGGDATTGRATSFHAARNRHGSALRYDVHPEDLVRIIFAMEAAGEALVAVFHSHTRSAAVPSTTDAREARYDVVHLIASLADDGAGAEAALRAWRIADGTATEVAIRISE